MEQLQRGEPKSVRRVILLRGTVRKIFGINLRSTWSEVQSNFNKNKGRGDRRPSGTNQRAEESESEGPERAEKVSAGNIALGSNTAAWERESNSPIKGEKTIKQYPPAGARFRREK